MTCYLRVSVLDMYSVILYARKGGMTGWVDKGNQGTSRKACSNQGWHNCCRFLLDRLVRASWYLMLSSHQDSHKHDVTEWKILWLTARRDSAMLLWSVRIQTDTNHPHLHHRCHCEIDVKSSYYGLLYKSLMVSSSAESSRVKMLRQKQLLLCRSMKLFRRRYDVRLPSVSRQVAGLECWLKIKLKPITHSRAIASS